MFTRRHLLITILVSSLACSDNATEPPPPDDPGPSDQVNLPPTRDGTLYEDSGDLGNGAGQFIFTGMTNQPHIRRAVLHFAVAGGSIPAGSTIDRVLLTLNMSRTAGGATVVNLHRLTTAWGEGASDAPGAEGTGTAAAAQDATWTHTFFDSSMWATPGGDFVTTSSANAEVAGTGFYTWGSTTTMVADVQSWLDNPSENFGWIVIGDESAPLTAKRFDSRENDIVDNRPKLTVFYSQP